MELLVRSQEADRGDDKELQDEGFFDFYDESGLVLKHALGNLAEQEGLLAQDCPVLFAQADELFVLNLIVLNSVVLLSLRSELVLGGLLLRKLHHH